MPLYECPKCGRVVEKPKGRYYCTKCGPSVMMVEVGGGKYPPKEEVIERWATGVEATGGSLSDELKRAIRESLAYALNVDVKDVTTRRVVVEDFYVALNRRKILTEDETKAEMRRALDLVTVG
jgi:DNA-directed RNA polymerase subunit RPC12/RpoP